MALVAPELVGGPGARAELSRRRAGPGVLRSAEAGKEVWARRPRHGVERVASIVAASSMTLKSLTICRDVRSAVLICLRKRRSSGGPGRIRARAGLVGVHAGSTSEPGHLADSSLRKVGATMRLSALPATPKRRSRGTRSRGRE